MRIAVGVGIEAGSEEDVLRDGMRLGERTGELIFGVAAARNEEGAKGQGEGFVEFRDGLVEFLGVLVAEDGDGDGVVEDAGWGVVDLVGGAAESYTERGAAWARLLHVGSV